MKHFYLKHGLSLLLLFFCLSASAYEKEISGLRFELDFDEGTARLLQGNYQGAVTIPGTVTDEGKTFTVTRIDDWAFSGCGELTSVSLPGTLTEIGNSLFSGCRNLTSVTLPENLTTVTESMFNGCESLTSISLPASVTRIESNAFAGCTGLTSFTLTADMEYVDDWAFNGCSGLKTLVLADSDRPLGSLPQLNDASLEKVYVGCRIGAEDSWYSPFSAHQATLSQVEFGPQLKEIQPFLFSGCYELTSVTLPASIKKVGDCAFQNCTGLTELHLGEGVDSIGSNAFSGCTGLTAVTLPAGVACVGDYAFSDCTALSSLSLNATIDSIGDGAFAQCSALTALRLPAVRRMGTGVFVRCTGLTDVTLAEGLTALPYYTFGECSALPAIRIPNSVTYIGKSAFMNCTMLTYIDIGKGVKHIDDGAFATWKTIQDVYYRGDVADWCRIHFSPTSYDEDTNPLSNAKEFHICLNEEEDSVLLTELTIPETVDSVSAHAFAYFRGLTSVTVPAHVKYVGVSAFEFCPYLTTVNIHGATLRERAFFMCPRLQNVTLGKEVTTLEEEAFGRRVTRLDYEGSLSDWFLMDLGERALLGSGMFNIAGEPLRKLIVPRDIETIPPYLFYGHDVITEIVLPPYIHVKPYAFAYCNYLDSVKQDTLYYEESIEKRQVASVVLSEKGCQIDDYAFYSCAKLTGVELPKSLTCIGNSAFAYCSVLPEITLPESLTQIGEYAFYECSQLERISIPENLALIGTVAFHDTKWYEQQPDGILYLGKVLYTYKGIMPAHAQLTVREGTTAICGAAFNECTDLDAIILPEGLTTIGNSAFNGCTGLNSITLPSSMNLIGNSAFYGCSSLGGINLPEGMATVGHYAFYGCTELEQIKLPSSLTQLGNYALAQCSSLKAVSLPAQLQSIGCGLLTGCPSLTDFTIKDSPDTLQYITGASWSGYLFDYDNSPKNVYIGRPIALISDFGNVSWWLQFGDALESIAFGPYVNEIEWSSTSSQVRKITVYNPVPPILSEDNFYNVDKETCVLYVPEGTTAAYAAAEGWKDFFNIQAFDATPVRTPQVTVPGTEMHYDVTGKIIDAKKPGLHIIRYSNGTSRKVLVK